MKSPGFSEIDAETVSPVSMQREWWYKKLSWTGGTGDS